jgi:hypothetical protein
MYQMLENHNHPASGFKHFIRGDKELLRRIDHVAISAKYPRGHA